MDIRIIHERKKMNRIRSKDYGVMLKKACPAVQRNSLPSWRKARVARAAIELQNVPSALYCHPQVASVGLTEAQAKAAGHAVKVAKFPLSASGKALALGGTEGFVKIVTDKKYGEILGAHIIGAEATELIGEFVLAKTLESTAAELKQSIHPHPTLSEAVMEAGGAIFGEAIHS